MIILETRRLLLRQFTINDCATLNSMLSDPDVMQFSTGILNKEQTEQWLNERLLNYKAGNFDRWAAIEKSSQKLIGYCGLCQIVVDNEPEVEIGHRFAREFWGQVFATEAAIAVRDYGFNALNLSRLVAIIDPANLRSIRVAEKIGMHYEKDVMLEGYTHPDHVYTISRKH
jgi:[ribosomal protein S5]-alanine N-acetyltransferase